MQPLTDIWRRLSMAAKAAVTTFREENVSTDFADPDDYTDVAARRMRYAIYWSMYENTAYRNIHAWAKPYRAQYGLYKFVRNIFNPAYKLGEFWVSHLMGGSLDPLAGDGSGAASACPIITENEKLRPALAKLWKDSNWALNKDIWTQHGSILGDAVLKINDDQMHQRMYLEVVHPGDISEAVFDIRGNVKSYRIDRTCEHPETGKEVIYTEIVTNQMGNIHYETLLDNSPYPWLTWLNNLDESSPYYNKSEWDELYGFVPMVVVQHHNVGLNWGWSEIHPVRSKMHEADDLASMISDQIRKTVNAGWLFAGVKDPASTPSPRGAAATSTKPAPGREETPVLYAESPEAKAQALVAPIDFPGAAAHLASIISAIENDYPELAFERLRLAGGVTGEALRMARQPAEQKVRQRRAGYDDGLKRAQQMAVAIGGMRKYPGYEGFDLDSYEKGELDHSIADRAVFSTDQYEKLDEDVRFWTAAAQANSAGYPLEAFLADAGWSAEKIRERLYTGLPEQ